MSNFLNPMNFEVKIKRAPNFNFLVQRASLPYIRLPDFDEPTPLLGLPQTGDHMEYGYFDVEFKVDDELKSYIEIHNWIRGLGFPWDNSEYKALEDADIASDAGLRSDISMIIMTGIKKPTYEFVFRNAFPVALSKLEFQKTDDKVNYLNAQVYFRYDLFDIVPIES